MKATQLPSGSWRVQITVGGKRISVTRPTKREAIKAAEIRAGIKNGEKTVGDMVELYISTRSGSLSPSTVAGYRKIQRNYFLCLQQMPLCHVDESVISQAISEEAVKHSPKTVSNAWELIRSAIATSIPVDTYRIHLPQKRENNVKIPTTEEVMELLRKVEGKPMEIPIKLAVFCGLRRSEIAALTYDDIQNGYININKALVKDENCVWRVKPPKSKSGYRRLKLPENIKISSERGTHITNINPDNMTNYCIRLTDGKYSMHDLRHYYASVLLKLNIPNKYAAAQMGHSGDQMLKRVYQHLFADASAEYDNLVCETVAHELHTAK